MDNGYIQSKLDYSLFTKELCCDRVFLLVYVDDMMIIRPSDSVIVELKLILQQNFKIKDLGFLRYFLGLEIARSSAGLVVNQHKYVRELIISAGLGEAKPSHTPMEQNLKLTTIEYDEAFDLNFADTDLYRRLVGKLLYLTMTMLNIAFSVHQLAQFVQ